MTSAFDRKSGIGGSDAVKIMSGDWLDLWMEKAGHRHPPPLDDVFRVQLGLVTEEFHLRWISKRQKIRILLAGSIPGHWGEDKIIGEPWRHKDYAFMYATLDGWDEDNDTHLEVKHCGGHATVRDRADYYMAQIQHQLAVTERQWCWFSIIAGNEEPATVKIDRNDDYISRLIEMEQTFWWHVQRDVKPDILPTGKLDAAAGLVGEILVGGFKEDMDMSRHNRWAELAQEYRALRPLKQQYEELCTELKTLIPSDRKRVFGHGVQIIRDKAGRLSIREDTS